MTTKSNQMKRHSTELNIRRLKEKKKEKNELQSFR